MYKVPKNVDFSILKDEVINQIAFGLNFITFFFNKGFIQVTGGFSFSCFGEQKSYDEVFPVENDFGLLQILEKKIINVSLNNGRDKLTIEFDQEMSLCLIGNDMYESFTIKIDGNEVIV